MNQLIDRMIRAARLDVQVYEEVEADQEATRQAMTVVILASVAAGVGMGGGAGSIILAAIGALLAWVIWAGLTYVIGTRLLPEPQTKADLGELLRTIGFSAAPGIMRVVGIIPGLMWFVFTLATIWMLVAMVIAVRQALDYESTGRAIAVCAIGFVVQVVAFALIVGVFGTPAATA